MALLLGKACILILNKIMILLRSDTNIFNKKRQQIYNFGKRIFLEAKKYKINRLI
jgi:hypothetical protein